MQTSLKRCGLKFSSRYDMSAKFPRGGSRTFFSSNSINEIFVRSSIHSASVEMDRYLFVSFDSLRPINNLPVIKGQVFLG